MAKILTLGLIIPAWISPMAKRINIQAAWMRFLRGIQETTARGVKKKLTPRFFNLFA